MSKTTRTILSLAMLALIFLLLGIAYHKDQAAAPELMTEAAVESITVTAASTEPAEAPETVPAPTVPPRSRKPRPGRSVFC